MRTCNDCLHGKLCWRRKDSISTDPVRSGYRCPDYIDRFAIPQCCIGDTVWTVRGYRGELRAMSGPVREMYYTEDMRICIVVHHLKRGFWNDTVFATQEEAENKIKELNSQ